MNMHTAPFDRLIAAVGAPSVIGIAVASTWLPSGAREPCRANPVALFTGAPTATMRGGHADDISPLMPGGSHSNGLWHVKI